MARDLIINPLIAVLIGRRLGRHVTRSFDVRPSRFPLVFPFGRFKEPPFHAPATLNSSSIFFSMMSLAVRWQSARFRWALSPPVASSPLDTHPSSSIEKRHALLTISRADPSIHLRVAKLALNSITRAPTSSPPIGAPHTCEH